ncbi:MAG: hypothetical protein M1376_24255 [Planctomycetes bacterium]|nr:hypothetical protein [Planctomycetota bacterium]
MQRRGMILAVLLAAGPALGQAPVGPSTAVLNGARLGLFAEYGQADTDITFKGGPKENFDFRTAFGGLAAALTSRWDFFVRVGASQAETTGFDGNWNAAWGLGTRATLLQWNDLGWGAMLQFTNLVSRIDTVEEFFVGGTPTVLPAEDELSLAEYVFATGPTWQQGPLSLYGGFLVRLTDGEFEARAKTERASLQADIDARWDAGGYVGGRVTLFKTDPGCTYGFSRCDLTAEGRFTGDSTAFSAGLLLPFGGEY